jgi:uncharacterized DUF497 family protein
MKIVWDEPKRLANLEKHGLDFIDVLYFGWEDALILAARNGRYKAIGRLDDGTAVVIYALLGSEALSIISFRPAGVLERRLFRDDKA